MKWTQVAAAAALALLGLSHLTCNQAIMTAPAGSTLTISANPLFIPANGGVSVISALVIEPAGTPVADGTVVQFFTNLGSIPEQGRTNDGVVRVNLVADSRSGIATVTAISGGGSIPSPSPSPSPTPTPTPTPTPGTGSAAIGVAAGSSVEAGEASDSIDVTIGNPNAANIEVVADPPRITNSRSTHITAIVYDAFGNPIRSVPVYFVIVEDPATEFMDNPGPVFTDNDGRASSVMRTRRATSGTATVRAQVPGGPNGTVDVAVVVP
jgi:Bacterial Ig-like domain (group 1)